jgi:hypothetical protein
MRQHHKKLEGSNKRKRQKVWERGLEILKTMTLPKPLTKRIRRMAFSEARKQARSEYSF